MYAIVNIAGEQIKVTPKATCYTPKLPNEIGSQVTFDQVLLVENEKEVSFGAPFIKGAKVVAKVIAHPKGDKVIVFKKKRRKGYKKTQGHRQDHTQLLIETITQ